MRVQLFDNFDFQIVSCRGALLTCVKIFLQRASFISHRLIQSQIDGGIVPLIEYRAEAAEAELAKELAFEYLSSFA
jgi:hypothetical protein